MHHAETTRNASQELRSGITVTKTQTTKKSDPAERSVLASLRALIPARTLQFSETLRLAEIQAARLRSYCGVGDEAMPEEAIALLPRIVIERQVMPTSGLSYWHRAAGDADLRLELLAPRHLGDRRQPP